MQRPNQLVSFGTSGHRGSALHGTFNEAHILAITQAICEYRKGQGTDGPLLYGEGHPRVSGPAQRTALEVLAANGVETIIQEGDGVTPTPVISRAILVYNRGRKEHLADGIVITPSHNPPEDGGFKYNPPNGGPADTDVTRWVQDRANELLRAGNAGVKRSSVRQSDPGRDARTRKTFVLPYVRDLKNVVDMDAIRGAKPQTGRGSAGRSLAAVLGTDQLDLRTGHRSRQSHHRPDVFIHDRGSRRQDPHGLFQSLCDGEAGGLKDQYQVAFANDPDSDRHGIVTPVAGLMNPNHYLAVAIRYLLTHRPQWRQDVCGRKDAGEQQHDRPGGQEARPQTVARCR